MSLRARMGGRVHEEYVKALVAAKQHVDHALTADDPAVARRSLAAARAEIGRADTRAAVARR